MTLPKLTPPEIKEWVRSVEQYHPVAQLAMLPIDANTQDIKEAFEADKSTLIGIGESLVEAAKWAAWPDESSE